MTELFSGIDLHNCGEQTDWLIEKAEEDIRKIDSQIKVLKEQRKLIKLELEYQLKMISIEEGWYE